MRGTRRPLAVISLLAMLASVSPAQEPVRRNKNQTVAPSAASSPVIGSGNAGQITKWVGSDTSNSFTVGNSIIFEDKSGKVGIGTTAPTSSLTVRGMIETTLGGIKFPDGTTQTTAGVSSVFHDASLQGAGTAASLLGVAVPLKLSGSLDDAVFSATNSGSGPNGLGVLGISPNGVGVFGQSTGGNGVTGQSTGGEGMRGVSGNSTGVHGLSSGGDGVKGEGLTGVSGKGNDNPGSSGNGGDGVFAQGGTSNGSRGGAGVSAKGGTSSDGPGGDGVSAHGGDSAADDGGVGLRVQGGASSGPTKFGGDAIFALRGAGLNGAASGFAGSFVGNVDVQGKLTKTMGTFKIDHPLDPENKYLYHSFVESPDMMNLYNGTIITDVNGEAVVEMPDYFDALNKDFRYQLTVIGTFAQAIVAAKMKNNRFVIKTNAPNVEVSWMVTGVRQDAYANKNRVQVEENKPEKERGFYLHPEVFDQPEEKSVEWARHPEMMQRLKQQRAESQVKGNKQQ